MHGQHGIIGVHAQEPAIQTQELGQCFTMATCHVVEHQRKPETVNVNKISTYLNHGIKSLCNVWILVEGAWTTWDNWGACSGTCDSNTRSRPMLYNGNIPCTGASSETGNCQCKKDQNIIESLHIIALQCLDFS